MTPRRPRGAITLAVALTAASAAALLPGTAGPAAARSAVGFGIGVGVPLFVLPPPPPPPPPPAVLLQPPPPPGPEPGWGCQAGALLCALPEPGTPGDACTCSTPRGPAWGRVAG